MDIFNLGYDPKEEIERKQFKLDDFSLGVQKKEEDGEEIEVATFKGIANVMEHKDQGGDIVHKGAFKKTLQEKDGKVPFVTDHTYKIGNYVGIAHLKEDGNELKAEVEVLLTDNEAGKDFYQKARFANKRGQPLGLSIGYDIPKDRSEVKDGVRHIYEVKLWEVSGVLFPMNGLSRAVGFKDLQKYSKDDLKRAKELIDLVLQEKSPLDGTSEQSTSTEDADLLKQLTTKLQTLNKS